MRCAINDRECVPGRLKRGWCEKHYRRWRLTGDTSVSRTPTLTRYEVDPEKECWIYSGPVYSNGYGKLSRKENGTRLAHRASYIEHVGPVSSELDLDHLCRVRRCMNPAHLQPVPRSTNIERGYRARLDGKCRNGLHPSSGGPCKPCKLEKDRRAGAKYRSKKKG